MDIYRPQSQAAILGTRVDMRAIMKQVYVWMTAGLFVTFAVALAFAVTGLTVALYPLMLVVAFAELGVVWYLSARIMQMPVQRVSRLFLLYAAMNGVTLSVIFYMADLADITLALFATGAMFGAMSIIGYTTAVDLSKYGGILLMALIGLIIASIVNIFWASSGLYWLITYAGVLIFVALTAYDTQWIKRTAYQVSVTGAHSGEAVVKRVAVLGALHLYLDFINLFIYILRILASDRR